MKNILHITQVLPDRLVGFPSSGVNRCRLTKEQGNTYLIANGNESFWAKSF